ncbi:MAG: hypothetical protein RL367_2054 [Pseudomonadota bacterium]
MAKLAFALFASLALTGCASIKRPLETPEQVTLSATDSQGGIRFLADAPPVIVVRPGPADYNVLALSGGGPDGAYGVGLLQGWSRSGRRPVFDVVTGVSTGALIAPFAFLGSSQDEALAALYTGDQIKTILSHGSALALRGRPHMFSSAPLHKLITAQITPDLLAAIAREYRSGRSLFIATANFDAQRLTIWDMGKIADRGTPEAQAQFVTILLAATSVPLALEPVKIGAAPGITNQFETHVDANVLTHFYASEALFPIEACQTRRRQCHLYTILHNKTLANPEIVRWSAPAFAKRSVETIMKANLAAHLQESWRMAQASGVHYHLAYLDVPFAAVSPIDFDLAYMRRIYALGLEKGGQPETWRDTPPKNP